MTSNGRDTRLMQLLSAVRGRKSALIQVHNNPDPDAIGSAVGIRALYQRFIGIESRIVFGGIVGRAENRTMLRLLRIGIVPAHKIDYGECDLLTLVDTQPGTGHTLIPDGCTPHVVIDHHPELEAPEGVLYWDVGRPYGATCTIVAEMFLINRVAIDKYTATALMYGIKSDTHGLGEDATAQDLEAYHRLYRHCDTGMLARIEHARVPRSYYAVFQRAIEQAQIYDFACVSYLGRIDNPDMVAEMADFILRCEDLRWSLVMGVYKDTLYLSMRATGRGAHAGSIARKAVGVMGTAGGHGRMAGGQIPLGDADKKTRQKVVDAVTELFLDAVKAKRSLRQDLTNPTMLDETDTDLSELEAGAEDDD